MIRIAFAAFVALSALAAAPTASAQQPATAIVQPSAADAADPIPRAERARARQDCLSENIALSGEDLRAAMRDCMQGKFPDVRLYARDGVLRDGRPTAAAARAACKTEIDGRGIAGSERTAALVACFNGKRPDLAQRADCRKDARGRGLDGTALRQAVDACAREGRS